MTASRSLPSLRSGRRPSCGGRCGRQQQVLVDVESEAWAALRQEDGQWFVRQGGDVALWDAAEEQLARWAAAGRPRLEEVAVTVTSGGLSYDW
jgi:hypothetical protein